MNQSATPLHAQCSCGCGTPVGNVHKLLKPLWNRCDYFETSYRALLSPRCGPVPGRRNRDTRRPPSLPNCCYCSARLLAADSSAHQEEFAQERLLLYRVIVREEVGLRPLRTSAPLILIRILATAATADKLEVRPFCLCACALALVCCFCYFIEHNNCFISTPAQNIRIRIPLFCSSYLSVFPSFSVRMCPALPCFGMSYLGPCPCPCADIPTLI